MCHAEIKASEVTDKKHVIKMDGGRHPYRDVRLLTLLSIISTLPEPRLARRLHFGENRLPSKHRAQSTASQAATWEKAAPLPVL